MSLRLHVARDDVELVVEPTRLVVAGYTGRDEDAVARHIAELEEIGVPGPATVPCFYDLDPGLLTTGSSVDVAGDNTSGEVEPVIVRHRGRHYLAVGSDHTDRDLERDDVARSKAACPKPLGVQVYPLPEDLDTFEWDAVVAWSHVDDRAYQHGTLAELRRPGDVLTRLTAALGEIDGDLVVFGGTLPLLAGAFVPGARWSLGLRLADGTVLSHRYESLLEQRETRSA